ncbi:hypothetical protein EHQ42_05680, partial [Leptospira levettii]|uniref:ATP-dependent nuclease n=1 Tax=Leptospira levettii TaxID=2023178 RepID=UPI001083FA32
MSKVVIENLKNIRKLEFTIPENKGIYYLTGINGSGKTTLLFCLHRIGDKQVFTENFKPPKIAKLIDSYKNCRITYSFNDEIYTFTCSETRWTCVPRKTPNLLKGFGFKKVIFVKADGNRLEPAAKDLKARNPRLVDEFIKTTMNKIFSTTKFNNLKSLRVSRGISERLIHLIDMGNSQFYSETNFSLGEITILKLLYQIRNLPPESLILIDEFEMALYPKAQVLLKEFLEKYSKDNDHTVILATHSVNLIQSAKKERILFLDQNERKESVCINPCFPTYALSSFVNYEDIKADFYFFVEDLKGKVMLTELIKHFFRTIQREESQLRFVIIPLGGWDTVLRFYERSKNTIVPEGKSCSVFLDGDSKLDLDKKSIDEPTHETFTIYKKNKNNVHFLDELTPEIAIIKLIEEDISKCSRELSRFFNQYQIEEFLSSSEYVKLIESSKTADNKNLAKTKLFKLTETIN